MPHNALQVISDDPGNYRWILLTPTDDWDRFVEHSSAHCDFDNFDAAVDASSLALAGAGGESFENEASDPAGMRIAIPPFLRSADLHLTLKRNRVARLHFSLKLPLAIGQKRTFCIDKN